MTPTTFPQMLPSASGNRPPLSEEELQRLAALLQQRGEGLAAINPSEASLLKALGGSGEPIAGTEGLGVGRGPIKSYQYKTDADYEAEDAARAAAHQAEMDKIDADHAARMKASQEAQAALMAQFQTTPATTTPATTKTTPSKFSTDPAEAMAYQLSLQEASSGEAPPVAPPAAPVFYDDLGRSYATQAEATAANVQIAAQRTLLESKFANIASDADLEILKLQNPDMFSDITDLPDDEIQTAFDSAKKLATYEGTAQQAGLKEQIVNLFNLGTFSASGQRKRDETGGVVDVVPTTFEEADKILSEQFPNEYARLSQAQRRAIFDDAQNTFERKAHHILTEEDIDVFSTEAPTMAPVADVEDTQITEELEGVTVGEVDPLEKTVIDWTPEIESDALDKLTANEEELVQILKDRVAGAAPSPAEKMHTRQTETNLRMLLGASVGAAADRGRLRQVQNLWRDIQQVATGQAAELRSAEQIAAEDRLLKLYQTQGTREASLALAKLSAAKDVAFKNGDLAQAGNLAQMEANITRVAAQASADLVQLEAKKQILIQNGQMSLATKLANLEKSILISQTNSELALRSRSLDEALALAAFQGEMAMEGLEVTIELAEMDAQLKTELTKLGIDSQEKLAALSRAQQLLLAEMNVAMQNAANDQSKQNAILGALGTVLAVIWSDRRAKKKIKPAKTKVQDFLDSLKAYSYEYKKPDSPGARHGEMLGVMAQDLEKTTLGKQFVRDTPHGKLVDMGQGLAAILASQAYLNDRVKTLAKRV